MIKFWLPAGVYEIEVIIPQTAMNMLLRVAVHEIGHAEVASHFGGRVLGVAFEHRPDGMIAQAVYEISANLPLQEKCTILAAGSAGEVLAYGSYGELDASGDRKDMAAYDGGADYAKFVEKAKTILLARRERFDRLTELLRSKLLNSNDELTMGVLPTGKVGAFVLTEEQLK
jgi:hypothetical protein